MFIFAWVFVAGMIAARLTTPDDPLGVREVFASFPEIPMWVKFCSFSFTLYVFVLMWPALVLRYLWSRR